MNKLYFDYDLQVWVRDGLVQDCGHPSICGPDCCPAHRYAGWDVDEAKAAERAS